MATSGGQGALGGLGASIDELFGADEGYRSGISFEDLHLFQVEHKTKREEGFFPGVDGLIHVMAQDKEDGGVDWEAEGGDAQAVPAIGGVGVDFVELGFELAVQGIVQGVADFGGAVGVVIVVEIGLLVLLVENVPKADFLLVGEVQVLDPDGAVAGDVGFDELLAPSMNRPKKPASNSKTP